MAPKKVNCHSYTLTGGHHLVFMVEGTEQCVGEIRITADVKHLGVISQLFASWTTLQRDPLSASISNIINGRRAANR